MFKQRNCVTCWQHISKQQQQQQQLTTWRKAIPNMTKNKFKEFQTPTANIYVYAISADWPCIHLVAAQINSFAAFA